jgi:hypothetical protein
MQLDVRRRRLAPHPTRRASPTTRPHRVDPCRPPTLWHPQPEDLVRPAERQRESVRRHLEQRRTITGW